MRQESVKAVHVKEQVRLSLAKCFELVFSGIKFRLFRAAITVVIIALAAAFLTTMLTESLSARKVAAAVDEQTWPREMFLLLASRISQPMTAADLSKDLAEDKEALPAEQEARRKRVKEFQTWGKLSGPEADLLVKLATRQAAYGEFFKGLQEGQRRALVGRAVGTEVFQRLLEKQANVTVFKDRMDDMALWYQFPDANIEQFQEFLNQWQQTKPLRLRILNGHRQVIERLSKTVLAERGAKQVLAEADEKLLATLRSHGFELSEQDLAAAQRQASLSWDWEQIRLVFTDRTVKNRLASRRSMKLASVTDQTFLKEIRSSGGAAWFAALAKELGLALPVSPERVQVVARERLAEAKVAEVEATVAEAAGAGGILGFSTRTIWLLVVSFLVCIVGIANAMLMSVTERFREIATMKCLGATDGFIMVNFILESCMQGIAGGVVGAVLGLVLGTVLSWSKYGWMALQNFPLLEVLTAGGLAFVLGIVISALAAVYPAWVAARLAPMEAMRIE